MKLNNRFIIFLIVVITSSCSANKRLIGNNCSYYKLKTHKTKLVTKPVIYGTFYDCETNTPLINPVLKINDSTHFKGDSKGRFKFFTYPGNYKFSGVSYPYLLLQTKTIKANKGDSIKIDFYLQLNTTPLVEKD